MNRAPITGQAWARAGLLGNPSDGYGGKTISLTLRGFRAIAYFEESAQLTICPDPEEVRAYPDLESFDRHVGWYGYYGSDRLVRATLRRFARFASSRARLSGPNFAIRVTSNIPRLVGMAGSSAIVMATLRGLMQWYGIVIAPDVLASLALSIERDELGIPAGLQDRVAQAYEGLVYMDFSPAAARQVEGFVVGTYERLDVRWLPRLYLAYSLNAGEPTEVTHSDLRARYLAGDAQVLAAIAEWAHLAELGRDALRRGDAAELANLINRNFDLRRRLCPLHPTHVAMIERAREVGVSAKFCGSGGAVIGTYDDDRQLLQLAAALEPLRCHVLPIEVADNEQDPPR